MDAPATLVWLAPQPPDTEQSRALSSWGSAHGLRLTEPRDERPPALTLDPRIPDEVEELLDRARDAVAARDGVAVDSALDAAEARLRAHPELPQSAWLMAEVVRGRTTRGRRVPPMDSEAAERSRLRAEALDGGRVPGVAEREGLSTPPAMPATVLLALSSGQQAWLDGAAVAAATDSAIPTRAGLHALVVTSGGAPIWAAWIEAPPGSSTGRGDAPDVPPGSSIDVSDARLDANAVTAVAADPVRSAARVPAAPGNGPPSARVPPSQPGR